MATYHLLDTIQLPRGMVWVDEFGDWEKVERSDAYSLTGALLRDVATRQEGRPITLAAIDDQGWIRRSVLLAVQALAEASADAQHTFVHADGRSFNVRFAADDAPITATTVARPEMPDADSPYVATLRLIEVSP